MLTIPELIDARHALRQAESLAAHVRPGAPFKALSPRLAGQPCIEGESEADFRHRAYTVPILLKLTEGACRLTL